MNNTIKTDKGLIDFNMGRKTEIARTILMLLEYARSFNGDLYGSLEKECRMFLNEGIV
jgi:hypothetical protein